MSEFNSREAIERIQQKTKRTGKSLSREILEKAAMNNDPLINPGLMDLRTFYRTRTGGKVFLQGWMHPDVNEEAVWMGILFSNNTKLYYRRWDDDGRFLGEGSVEYNRMYDLVALWDDGVEDEEIIVVAGRRYKLVPLEDDDV